jgi:membrane peptidoglycan carboxypeptidase
MEKITGGTAPAVLWSDFMQKAHNNIQPRALNYGDDSYDSMVESRKKIEEILRKSKTKPKKNVFESILDNFF